MWTRDANIARWEMTWDGAFELIKNLNKQKYAGYSDWRLPTKADIETLIDFAKGQGFNSNFDDLFNKIGFKNVRTAEYWSSTTGPSRAAGDTAWKFDMWRAPVYSGYRYKQTTFGYAWPVRVYYGGRGGGCFIISKLKKLFKTNA